MKNFRWAIALACAGNLLTSPSMAQTASAPVAAKQVDYIVAVVNSEPITNNELRARIARIEPQLARQGGAVRVAVVDPLDTAAQDSVAVLVGDGLQSAALAHLLAGGEPRAARQQQIEADEAKVARMHRSTLPPSNMSTNALRSPYGLYGASCSLRWRGIQSGPKDRG